MTITLKQCLLVYLGYDTGGVDSIRGDKRVPGGVWAGVWRSVRVHNGSADQIGHFYR